ncbi:MAG: hypothetical protein ACRDJI_04295, partial [Actinomycetota bacterium]
LCSAAATAAAGNEARRSSRGVAVTLPLPDDQPAPQGSTTAPAPASCFELPRATEDRRDLDDGPLVHVVYLVASDFPDEGLDTDGTLDCSVRAQNEWFRAQSGGMEWRVDTFTARTTDPQTGDRIKVQAADVTFVASKKKGADLYGVSEVEKELQSVDLSEEDKRYLVYVAAGDDSGPCGDAWYPIVTTPDPNANGRYATVYMFSAEGCHAHEFGVPGAPSWVEMIAQQEIIHNDGLTPIGAPHSCAYVPPFAHVCTPGAVFTEGSLNLDPERVDVMFPFVAVPLSEKVLDRGHDDYFDHLFPLQDLKDSSFLRAAQGG